MAVIASPGGGALDPGAQSEFWRHVYENAVAEGNVLSGFYNHNYLYQLEDGQTVVVRVPVSGRDELEPRMFAESDVINCAMHAGIRVPRVLAVSESPQFQVHEYMPGIWMSQMWPRGVSVPGHFITDAVSVMRKLHDAEPPQRINLVGSWRYAKDNRDFLRCFAEWQQKAVSVCRRRFNGFFRWIELPDEPFSRFVTAASRMSGRKLQLCHGDLQRLNFLIDSDRTIVLDWELALHADPLWDVSAHLHRMRYPPHEEQEFLTRAREALSPDVADSIDSDLPVFFSFECLKSVTNDAFRYLDSVVSGRAGAEQRQFLAGEYAWKLSLAAEVIPLRSRTESEIAEYFDNCAPPR